jgi:hypothetical protein
MDQQIVDGRTDRWTDGAQIRSGRTVRQTKIQTGRLKDKQTDQWTDV